MATRKPTEPTPDAREPDQAVPFEQILTQLEELVKQLESGELPLEDSLAVFEKGMALSRQGTSILAAAEKKVEILLRDRNGEPEIRPFEGGE
jgi:exodeoxyribonuclease VII small subunit